MMLTAAIENKQILVSAGPMRTHIDPVRYIQNRSSGKLGLELCRALRQHGARPVVALGPVDSSIGLCFKEFTTYHYTSSTDYLELVTELFPSCETFFSLAAVLDFEIDTSVDKIERSSLANADKLELKIKRVPDIVAHFASVKSQRQKVIAFAAQSGTDQQIISRAEEKRRRKNLDVIVANPVRQGIGPESDIDELWILREGQSVIHLGPAPKSKLVEPMLHAIFGRCS